MCLYPITMTNPRYKKNKSNGGVIPECIDYELTTIDVPCGVCIECRRKKASQWKIRLSEELKHNPIKGQFITLTYNDEELEKLMQECNNDETEIFTKSVRRWLELVRYHTKHQPRHWLIAEKGQNNTERLHIHGIIWDNPEIVNKWKYGRTDVGWGTNSRTVGYLVKYMLKPDPKHANFKSKILTSRGIGLQYIKGEGKRVNKYDFHDTNENYRLPNGQKVGLPQYFRQKLWSTEEREFLRLMHIYRGKVFINGIELKNNRDGKSYWKIKEVREYWQKHYEKLGYTKPTQLNFKQYCEKNLAKNLENVKK